MQGPEFDAQIKKKVPVLNYKVNDTGTNNGDVLPLQRKRETESRTGSQKIASKPGPSGNRQKYITERNGNPQKN